MSDETPSAEDWERFAAIVRDGGTIWCAPDVHAALTAWLREHGAPVGDNIRVHTWMEAGTIMAAAKQPPLKLTLDIGGVDMVITGKLTSPLASLQAMSLELGLTGSIRISDPEDAIRFSTYQRPSDDELRARIRDEFGV